MTKHTTKLAGWAAASLLTLAATASADVTLNDHFAVGGYAVGSYKYTDVDGGTSTDRLDMDAVKTLFTGTFKPVTGVLSLYYQPNAPQDVTVLDAYATLDAGSGVTVTAGKFLSYLGYEAFDIPNMTQISYANGDFLAPIPGYHTGVKVDYSSEVFGAGAAILDSVYSGPNYLKGDGELKHNGGFEGYLAYKGVKNLTVWAGFGYDTKGSFEPHDVLTLDLWLSYAIDASTFGAEICSKDGGPGAKGYNWLLFYSYAFTDKISSAFRVSGEDLSDGGPGFTKLTVCPTYKINDNFSVRAEVSYYDYTDLAGTDSATFFGVQTIFKF